MTAETRTTAVSLTDNALSVHHGKCVLYFELAQCLFYAGVMLAHACAQ